MGSAPLRNATRPVAAAGVTVAVIVAFWPRWTGLGETLVIVVTVGASCPRSGSAATAKHARICLCIVTRFVLLDNLDAKNTNGNAARFGSLDAPATEF